MDLFPKMRFVPFFIMKHCISMFYEINLTFPTDKQSINEWQKKNNFRSLKEKTIFGRRKSENNAFGNMHVISMYLIYV